MLSKRLLSSLYRVEDGRLISRLTNREAGYLLNRKNRYVVLFDEEIEAQEIIKILERGDKK